MELLLSSAALPDGSLRELRIGMERRNFAGLEVVVGAEHAHGIEATCEIGSSDQPAQNFDERDPPIHWLFPRESPSVAEALYWGRRAHLLGAGLALPGPTSASPAGLPVALAHSTDRASAQRAAAWARMHHAHTCWEVEVGRVDAESLSEVLNVTAPHLGHVRLLGGGPESSSGDARETGTADVLKQLALQGFSGTVALAPSDEGAFDKWRRWLLEERGWGCNTAVKKKEASSELA